MANYYSSARTNYVNVTDLEALKESVKGFPVTVSSQNLDNPNKIFFLSNHETGWDMQIPIHDSEQEQPKGELIQI